MVKTFILNSTVFDARISGKYLYMKTKWSINIDERRIMLTKLPWVILNSNPIKCGVRFTVLEKKNVGFFIIRSLVKRFYLLIFFFFFWFLANKCVKSKLQSYIISKLFITKYIQQNKTKMSLFIHFYIKENLLNNIVSNKWL